VEAIELDNMAATISFTRQLQTKLNFKLLHALGQNTGQDETKVLLTMFNRINAASFE